MKQTRFFLPTFRLCHRDDHFLQWMLFNVLILFFLFAIVVFPNFIYSSLIHHQKNSILFLPKNVDHQQIHNHQDATTNVGYTPFSAQQDNNNSSNTDVILLDFGRFHKCANYSVMTSFFPCLNCDTSIPNNFACRELIMPEKIERSNEWSWNSRSDFFYKRYLTSGKNRDVCAKVSEWEKLSRLRCYDLLCRSDNIVELALQISNGETTIFDWFNYCQYCSKDYIFDLKTCKFNDTRFYSLPKLFPTSLLTCGAEELGIPVLVNANTSHDIYSPVFYITCYCTESDFFGHSCWYTAKRKDFYDFLSYLGLCLHGITFCAIFFISFIPKFIYSFRLRKWRNMATMALVVLCEASSIASYITLIIGDSNLFIALEYSSLYIGYFSLITWIKFWFHLVRFAKSKKYKSTWCSGICLAIVFLVLLMLVLALPILSILIKMQIPTEFVVAMNFVLLLSIVVAILTYIGLSCYIYFVMRKVSDIDLFQTWFLRFVFFSSAIITIMGCIHICMILFDFASQDPVTGALYLVVHALLIVLMVGISYMEFEKSEFFEVYACFGKCRKKGSSYAPVSEINHNDETNNDQKQLLTESPTI
ncbi:hypothetical protein C9374_007592 [Naegleria lovaniensis]|uniref:Uncharacterized protein n=1 Tax=Naegleria lovaniensis TaxID=51637 RepID=A0AA88GGG4_NAELO|nr:uncharacterized protein C9374_007592 [Naegleria lovaniensis]KAG2378954.1 hypothetical protein C9374_007592 [Naegleria lovaniensis]